MAALTLHLPHRDWTLRDRVRVRWARDELDRRLAEGARPGDDPLLRRRADRLVSPASRAVLAAGLERVVASVEETKTPFTAAVPVRRAAVRGARHDLMALAGDLRHMPAPRSRGVAMAERLITDPSSPLYTATTNEDVQRAVHAAAHWLR